jgi:hypothetical protein
MTTAVTAPEPPFVVPPIPEGLCGVGGCVLKATHTLLRSLEAQRHTWER